MTDNNEHEDQAPSEPDAGADGIDHPADGTSDQRSPRSGLVKDASRRVRHILHTPSHTLGDAAEATRSHPDPFCFRIYDPLRRAISDLTGERDELDFLGPEEERPHGTEAHLSIEETLRLGRLRRLGADPRGPWRSLIRGTPAMLNRIAAVRAQAPHSMPFVDLVLRSLHIATSTDTPLRLPPVLLLGEPGIGKTYVAKHVEAAIGSSFSLFPMNITDTFRLRGLNTAWKRARSGRIAETMLAANMGSPIVLLDELGKTQTLDRADRPFDIWHSLWEPENSVEFVEYYYEIPLRCDRVIWIASANSTDALPDSILDRLLILRVPVDPEQVLVIINGLYRTARERLNGRVAETLAGDVRATLAKLTPRRARRILDPALGFMAAEGRMAISSDDVEQAARIAGDVDKSTFRHPVGFRR